MADLAKYSIFKFQIPTGIYLAVEESNIIILENEEFHYNKEWLVNWPIKSKTLEVVYVKQIATILLMNGKFNIT